MVTPHGAPGPAAPPGPRSGWQEDDPTTGNPSLRQLRITTVDGRPVPEAGAFDLIRHWWEEHMNPYRPAAVVQDADGVLIRYPLIPEGHT